MSYKTIIGKLVCVEPRPDYYMETDDGEFIQVEFVTESQAYSTPLQTTIALAVSSNNIVSTESEYYKNVGA